MFNGAQIPSLLPTRPDSRPAQFRALTRLINQGTDLAAASAQAGYEIVSVPSEYFEGAIVDADRNLDTGQLSSFEMQLLQTGDLRNAFGGIEKTLAARGAPARVLRPVRQPREPGRRARRGPKLVFGHLLVPHMPIAFNRDGSAAAGLPCFPM